jgi:hypothetical protein
MPTTNETEQLLDKHQAAKRLGVHWRTVLLFAKDGKLQSESVRDSKTNQMTMKFPVDAVERLRKERAAPVVNIKPVEKPETGAPKTALQRIQPRGEVDAAVLLNRVFERLVMEPHPPAPKPWLNLQEASEYSGLSARLLRLLVRRGELPALRDEPERVKGRKLAPGETLRIKRADLDELDGELGRESQGISRAQAVGSEG